jgi:hypothetical protein
LTALLNVVLSHPLEREYEAWVARSIEDYFVDAGIGASVWAISPADEVNWPADLAIAFPAKLLGLQIKRPYAKTPSSFSALYWKLAQPAGQRELVLKTPEIYYCFPCFLNRNFRRVSLPHCVFWRPDHSPIPSKVWYDNVHGRIRVADKMRWGRLIERLTNCEIGYLVDNSNAANNYIARFRQAGYMATDARRRRKWTTAGDQLTTVFVAVPI